MKSSQPTIAALNAALDENPDDWETRRALADALQEAGDEVGAAGRVVASSSEGLSRPHFCSAALQRLEVVSCLSLSDRLKRVHEQEGFPRDEYT